MIGARIARVLDGTSSAHLATFLPDGSPRTVPLWMGAPRRPNRHMVRAITLLRIWFGRMDRRFSVESAAYGQLPVGARCLRPGQQQGRRLPSSSSSWVRRMRRVRVISCLASSTQQMNSLRANGVMSFQAASAVALAISAVRRSAGSL
jgi:hypothetical protein